MSCLICLNDLDKDVVTSNKCSCSIEYHTECYNTFINKSKFFCPICRVVDNKINRLNNRFGQHNILFYYVFKLPPPIAVCLWFIVSILFFIFVFPILFVYQFLYIKEFRRNSLISNG
jgi:hypothetical protein